MPRRHRSRLTATLALALLVLLAALPAAAYTIYLKDGSKLLAEEKYEVRDGKAYITLRSGTETFIDLSEIDVKRTEEANTANLGSAMVIEGGETREIQREPPRPQEPTLGDLIEKRRRDGDSGLDDRRSPAERSAVPVEVPQAQRTAAGYVDLLSFPRRPFGDLETGAELKQFFSNQGLEEAQIYQGSEPDRPLVDVTTNSEASVFRALAVAASALVSLRERGRSPAALELFLATPSRERAGQFLLTPDLARDLLSSKVDVTTFYLQNVQF